MKKPGTLILPWLCLPRMSPVSSPFTALHLAAGSSSSRILLLIQSLATEEPAIPWTLSLETVGFPGGKMPAAAPSHRGQPVAKETPFRVLVPWEPSPQPTNREFPPQNPPAAQAPHLVPMCFPRAKVKLCSQSS